LSSKSVAIENDVIKLRPKNVTQERERLYDDVVRQRMETNNLKDENTKLRTRLQITESEINRKDKIIDELI
jgi:hypothetical protein